MNRRVDFTQLDGIDLTEDLLDFMQQSYRDAIGAIATSLGDKLILNGVVDNGTNTTGGWVIIAGELMPFIGSASALYVYVDTLTGSDLFGDGNNRNVEFTKVARLTSVQGTNLLFSDFRPFKSDATNLADSNVLASANAVKLLADTIQAQLATMQAQLDGIGYLDRGTELIGDLTSSGTIRTVTHNLNVQGAYGVLLTIQGYAGGGFDNTVFYTSNSHLPNSFKIVLTEAQAVGQNIRVNWFMYKL